jgi:hypothetical protein
MAAPKLQPVVAYCNLDKTIFANTTSSTTSLGYTTGDNSSSAININNNLPGDILTGTTSLEENNDLDSDDEMDISLTAMDSSDKVLSTTSSHTFDIGEHIHLPNPVLLDYLSNMPCIAPMLEGGTSTTRAPLEGTNSFACVTYVLADAFQL